MINTKEEREKKCGELYTEDKSRKFMLHMIRSYAQIGKVSKVLSFKEGQKHKCALCGVKLVDIDETLTSFQKNVPDMLEAMRTEITNYLANDACIEAPAQVVELREKHLKDSAMAYTGESTDTCICGECAVAIHEFTINEMARGNNDISKVVNSMRKRDMPQSERRDAAPQYVNVKSTQTLGDAPVFSKLLDMFKA